MGIFRIILSLGLAVSAARADGFLLRDGDRVLFLGDSITEQGLYARYVQQYVHGRYPGLDIRFFNAGLGGDTAKGALGRVERDVLPCRPTVVLLLLGMNDGGYRPPDAGAASEFGLSYRALLDALRARGARVVCVTPGCVDPDRNAGLREYNATLAGLAKVVLEEAGRAGFPAVDLHHPMLDRQARKKAEDAAFTMIPDGVHPDPEGHRVMADILLRGLGAEAYPAPEEGLTPCFCDAGGLGGPILRREGLPEGRFDVEVDGTLLGTFTAEELSHGVDMGGRWSRPARLLAELVETKARLQFDAWRRVRLPHAARPGGAEAIDALERADEALHRMVRAAAAAGAPPEISVTPAPSGGNLALGATYECSDPNEWGWSGGLTDGSWEGVAGRCFATGRGQILPKSVTIDLGGVRTLSLVRFGVPPFGSTKTVEVSLGESRTAFGSVGSARFRQGAAQRRTLGFEPRKARYIRLTFPDRHEEAAGYPREFAFLSEVEAYEG